MIKRYGYAVQGNQLSFDVIWVDLSWKVPICFAPKLFLKFLVNSFQVCQLSVTWKYKERHWILILGGQWVVYDPENDFNIPYPHLLRVKCLLVFQW